MLVAMSGTFVAQEFTIEGLPPSLKDKTLNIFSLSDEGPSDVSVVVARDKLRPGETLQQYTERQKTLMAQRMARLQLLGEGATQLDGQPAWWIDFERVGRVRRSDASAPGAHVEPARRCVARHRHLP
jgi:hypothetical protein